MSNNIYLTHLICSILKHKNNAIKQYGKSDIDSPYYINETNNWYNEIFDVLKNKTLLYYVKLINVIEDSDGHIHDIQLTYFELNEEVFSTTIVIYDNRDG